MLPASWQRRTASPKGSRLARQFIIGGYYSEAEPAMVLTSDNPKLSNGRLHRPRVDVAAQWWCCVTRYLTKHAGRCATLGPPKCWHGKHMLREGDGDGLPGLDLVLSPTRASNIEFAGRPDRQRRWDVQADGRALYALQRPDAGGRRGPRATSAS